MSDNYARAKSIFAPRGGDGEKSIEQAYDDIDAAFQQVLSNFGLERMEVRERERKKEREIVCSCGTQAAVVPNPNLLPRTQSLGQPFDFNFMEAIMAEPSDEYADGLVCKEYQVRSPARLL